MGCRRAGLNSGTDPGEGERRPNEGLAHRLAIVGVVGGPAVSVFVTDRGVTGAAIHELRSQHLAFAELGAIAPQFFVDQCELVALRRYP